ncbi:PAS domain-containing protein [Phenylobacterium sp. LjRoot225]|uniref:sensor histidine kinase n=1 Tax=Phenylobacterium sp. LjRoot225 TaxID=3342285 RepID=UPI003ECC786D
MRDVLQDSLAAEPSFRDVADALSLGVPFLLHLGPDGRSSRFLRLGSACLPILGIPPDAILADSRAFAELISPEDQQRLLRDKASVAGSDRLSTAETRIRKPGGELRWIRMTSASRPASDGGRLLDGLIVDITDSKRMAEQLADERQRLEQAIELTHMGVFQWDRDDPDTVLWSDHQYAVYGVPPRTPITVAAFRGTVHPDDKAVWEEAVLAATRAEDGGDYVLEHRIVRPDGEVRWVQLHQRIRRDALGLKSIHGTTLDITERRDLEERRRLQMRELGHRAKNAMTVMMAMVQQAARAAGTVEELTELILSRFGAMSRSQDLATALDGTPLSLRQLLAQVLDPFDLSHFDIDPELETANMSGDSVILLALLLHELATNALKYGALSTEEGRVSLSLRSRRDGWVTVEWRERGGPPVRPPSRRGFGSRLLSTALLGHGGVTSEFAPDGFVAQLEVPVA